MNCKEQILSEDYRDFIISQLNPNELDQYITADTCVQELRFIYRNIYLEKDLIEPLSFGRYSYNSIPKCFSLLDTEAMEQAGILQIQNYPTLNLQGTGVMIGFIDTGIDYQNPIFRNLDGSTRIAGIWDQSVQSGQPPAGFLYGSEYTREQINAALRADNPLQLVPSVDTNSHGTFLASIAAGGANEENQFIGAAPDATLAVVKLKEAKQYLQDFYEIRTQEPCYQENDIMLGIEYLDRLASAEGLPLVICLALGSNMGGHSALSPLTGIMEIYANISQRIIVIAAGNEANQRHHYQGRLENNNAVEEVEIQVGENVSGFTMELWTENPNLLEVTLLSPSGGSTSRLPLRRNETFAYRYVFEGTTVAITYKIFLERSNAEVIIFQVKNPTEGIWKIRVEPVQVTEGVFHIWLPMREFVSGETYFLRANPDTTFTEPGSTISAMTVGFYNGNDKSIAISSGRGYTRGNIIKPNFVAPGVNVTGAIRRNLFAERTGSSIAAGITAGAVALLLEWILYRLEEESVDSVQIRNLLTLGTERVSGETYPNRTWGYGMLNLYRTFDEIRRI